MARLIVVLSGPVSSGKSTLAVLLHDRFGAVVVKTLEMLQSLSPETERGRTEFQELGEQLDSKTGGDWVLTELARRVNDLPENACVIVDSARIEGQISAIRRGYGKRVVHIHLNASQKELARRYKHRPSGTFKELTSYVEVLKNKTESLVPELAQIADVVIDTDRCTEEDVLVRAASHLGLYGRGCDRLVDVLVGGEFGSEGKGQVAAYLSNAYDLLIRVGGPNAGHKVYEEPNAYTFHILPSGTRCSTAELVIGAGAVICEKTLLKEIAECQVSTSRLSIDPQAIIITEEDRKREADLVRSIGSTGQGVGYATARRILDRGVKPVLMAKDSTALRGYVRDTGEVIERAIRDQRKILLEGTQGTGLSLYQGFYPHVTSRDTTVAGCLAEAGISPSRVRKVVMVCRTYPIRVQNPEANGATSGPM